MEFHKNINYDNYVLFLSTVQIQPFRTLMTALKEILTENSVSLFKQKLNLHSLFLLIQFSNLFYLLLTPFLSFYTSLP